MKHIAMAGFLAALLVPAASGNIVVYTDRADFLAALAPGYYEETFDGLSQGGLSSPQAFSGGGFSYDVSAPFSLWSGTIGGDRFLAVQSASDPLNFSNFGGAPHAFGGYFFFADNAGGIHPDGAGSITVTNGVDPVLVVDVPAPTAATTFFGFIGTAPLTSVSFVRTTDVGTGWASVNDIIAGNSAAIPEPGTVSMMVVGLGALGLGLRKRTGLGDTGGSRGEGRIKFSGLGLVGFLAG